MKLLLDFLPILIFFGVYKLTGGPNYGNCGAHSYHHHSSGCGVLVDKKVEKMALVTLTLVIVLGGLTVFLNDGWFIMWKPTVVNWLFAAAFFGSHFIGQKSIIERLLGHAISLGSQQWVTLSFAWIAFFIFSGVLNLIVAYQFSEDVWVNFKLFGLLGLTFIFLIIQGIWISKHGSEAPAQSEDDQNA